MPIYEFACPKCRKIFSFLSRRMNPDRSPACPKCGNTQLEKQLSQFATSRHSGDAPADGLETAGADDPRTERALAEMQRDMAHMDENNPRHMAQMLKKMKDLMGPGALPREMDTAIRRLEAGEDPEKIEQDMGDVLGEFAGGEDPGAGGPGYTRESGLYDY
jgi:putative FmdB family regulatory protein